MQRPILLPALCVLGFAAGAWGELSHRKASLHPALALATPPVAISSKTDTAKDEALLRSLSTDSWDEETTRALVLRLSAEPAFIRTLWKATPSKKKDQMMERTFRAICDHCPSRLCLVLEQADIPLPSTPAMDACLLDGLSAAPIPTLEAIRKISDRFSRTFLAGTVRKAFDRTDSLPAYYLAHPLEVLRDDQDTPRYACQILFGRGKSIPGDLDANNAKALSGVDLGENLTIQFEIVRKWARDGFPSDRIPEHLPQEAHSLFRDELGRVASSGMAPPPATLDILIRSHDSEAAVVCLSTMVGDGHIDQAMKCFNEMETATADPLHDELLTRMASSAIAAGEQPRLILDLIRMIDDPQKAKGALNEMGRIWTDQNPATLVQLMPSFPDDLQQRLLPAAQANILPRK